LKVKKLINSGIALILVICIISCSMEWAQPYRSQVSEAEINRCVSSIVDEQYDLISPYIGEEMDLTKVERLDGSEIVGRTLDEENGQDYLSFCYSVKNSYDVDEVLSKAKVLVSDQQYSNLLETVNETEEETNEKLRELEASISRTMPLEQQEAFLKDLKRLVIRSIVLLTAGIVYACMPKVVFWGKISAAAAISISAGILASTVLSIYDYYKLDQTEQTSKAFSDWIEEVTTTPSADYALAASIIAVGNTMKQGPVVTGIVVCVFSIYQIMDMVKPMLAHYNIQA